MAGDPQKTFGVWPWSNQREWPMWTCRECGRKWPAGVLGCQPCSARVHTVEFTRYEDVLHPPIDAEVVRKAVEEIRKDGAPAFEDGTYETVEVPMRPGAKWLTEDPRTTLIPRKNASLQAPILQLKDERVPWWRRVWGKVRDRLPRVHFGPCDGYER